MQTAAARAQSQTRPWIRRRGGTGASSTRDDGHEPAWARRTKWSLLLVAVALTAWTLFELSRTLLVLAEAPITVVTALPPLPPVSEDSRKVEAVPAQKAEPAAEPAPESTEPPEPPLPNATLRADELQKLRQLLETKSRPVSELPERPVAAPPARRPLLPGIARAETPRRGAARAPRPENALRVVSGPRVRLIGADALVDALVENRLGSPFERTVALELMVDGKQRQRRKLRLRIPPGARLHLSERFSTTLPDGTYSARLTVPPFG